MPASELKAIRDRLRQTLEQSIEELKTYCRFPSVSAQNKSISQTVQHVVSLIQNAGGVTQVLDDLGGNPVIFGNFAAGPNGNPNQTLLFYNHYDVQP